MSKKQKIKCSSPHAWQEPGKCPTCGQWVQWPTWIRQESWNVWRMLTRNYEDFNKLHAEKISITIKDESGSKSLGIVLIGDEPIEPKLKALFNATKRTLELKRSQQHAGNKVNG